MPRTTAPSSPPARGCNGVHRLRRVYHWPSALSPTPPAPCRWPRRPRCASTGCTSRLADALLRPPIDEIVAPKARREPGGRWRWTWTQAGLGAGTTASSFPVNLNTAPRELLLRARLWRANGETACWPPAACDACACRPGAAACAALKRCLLFVRRPTTASPGGLGR